jgi:hypothetical protein
MSDSIGIVGTLLTFFLGFITAVLAEPIRRWIFKPKLKLMFEPTDSFISKTMEANIQTGQKTADVHYIRIRVTNISRKTARDCRAYLVDLKTLNEKGQLCKTNYCDSIPVAWSCQGRKDRFQLIDIPPGVNQYIDVVVTRNTSDAFDLQLMAKPFRYVDLFRRKGKHIFTIQVCAQWAKPKRIMLELDWKGDWNDYVVKKVE